MNITERTLIALASAPGTHLGQLPRDSARRSTLHYSVRSPNGTPLSPPFSIVVVNWLRGYGYIDGSLRLTAAGRKHAALLVREATRKAVRRSKCAAQR